MAASAREEQSEAWRQRLERFVQSEQTVTAFCQQESVSVWSVYHWRRRLQRPASPSNEGAGA
ncbi:IS66 family insertion sequence element accessory protein TnpA [Trinickia symbiotica]